MTIMTWIIFSKYATRRNTNMFQKLV